MDQMPIAGGPDRSPSPPRDEPNSGPGVSESAISKPEDQSTPKPNIWGKLRKRHNWRLGALIVAGVLCLLGIAVTVLLEGWVVPIVWRWGFREYETSVIKILQAAIGIIGAIFLACMSLGPLAAFSLLWQIICLYFEDADDVVNEKVAATTRAQHDAEERLKEIEAQEDPTGLIQLVQYSRLQLDQYYNISLRQTRQSFRYSVIAMWIGFVVMIGGLLPFLLPLLGPSFKSTASTSINVVISAGGFIIELVAALFLWVYRSSIVQLTYFYDRQMALHNVLLCYKIAATMKPEQEQKSLDAKSVIIQKVLESTWKVERPESPGAKNIKDLIAHPMASAATAGK